MRRNRQIGVFGVAIAVFAAVSTVQAGFVEFFDRAKWEQALGGPYTTIDFTGFRDNEFLGEQYAPLGVHFTDGNDRYYFNSGLFLNDEWGVDGNGDIVVKFDILQRAIGFDHPGTLKIDVYRQGELIYASNWMGGGGDGFFSGIIGPEPFDRAVIRSIDEAAIDDMHFAVPTPAAAAMFLLALVGAGQRRR